MQLEQVKEHFKDAKEVRCLTDNEIFSFDDMDERGIHEYNSGYWFTSAKVNDCVKIYNAKTNELAEIITYKDKDMKITEQQVKDLDNGSTTARQLFPQVFATELEEGVWYKNDACGGSLFLATEFHEYKTASKGFGFDDFGYKFDNSYYWSIIKNVRKANLEEVKQRMTEELVKRGFVKGCSFTTPSGFFGEKNVSGILDFEFFNKDNNWIIYIDNSAVFHNGKFATLIKEPTQKEILQAKIKEIQEEIDKL